MDDVCRLCSSEVELMNVFNIDTGRLVNMIKVASGVEILQTDKISQKVCRQCCKLSAEVFRFRQRSAKNSQDLMEKYNKSIQSESPKIISNKEIHVDWNNIKITKNINVDSPNKSIKVHPSILQMKQQYPNIKFPPLQPDAHYQPFITLLTNEVSDWYQQRNSRTDALYQVDEESLEQPQSPSSSNDDSYSSSSELETVFSRDIEDQNEREETLLQKDQKEISQNITKNHSFSNIQDYEMAVCNKPNRNKLETNQIECQSNSIQNDPKQTSNVMEGIKRKRSVSQPTDEESIKETPRSKSSKIEIINNEIIKEKYVTTVNQNIKSNPQVENASRMKEKITNTSNSDKKKSSGVEEMNDVIEAKKPNENRSPSKLKTSKKGEIQNKKAESELNYNRDKEIIVNIKTREDTSQLIEEENCKKTSKIKGSEKLFENNEVNGKDNPEFNENTKIDQLEEKGANTSNNDKQGSSGIDEASELMETRKRKEGRSSCKVKKSKLEIENKNINISKEMEVNNQAGQKEKSSVNNVDEKKSTEEENLQEAHTNKNSMKEVINEKGDGKFVEKPKSKPVENKNQIEENEATKLKSVQNDKEIQNRNVSLANVETMKSYERQNEVLFKPTDKQPAINFCMLRNVLREKLKANSTNNETNNVESNDITTSSSILPDNTNISPSDNPNISPPDNPNISPPNNTLKMSFIRSLNLIPFSERGAYEKDTSHEMLRVRCIKYACEYCQTNYNTLRSLKMHEKKYHTSCVFCNLHLDSVENRKKHTLFYCPKRTIKVPKVVLVRVDKQKEMIAKYAQAFQLLNFNATSSAQTNNSIDVDFSDSESADYVNLRPLKLNWNVNNYNDVINAMNANDPNLLENIYNKIKDRTSFTLDNIVKSPTDNEYYLKNLAPELYFQKVKIILKCGKEIAFHYNEEKNLPATSPKNFWANETPIQPQVIQKTHQKEIRQTTVSPTNINHNLKTDKNANLQGNVGKVIDNVKNKVRQESNMTRKVTQSTTSQNTLQSPNVKQKVVGYKNPALPSPNSSKMNEILPPKMTGTEIQKTITQNIVALNNLNDKSVQNRLVSKKMEKSNLEKRRQFHKANMTSSTNTATTSQAINVQNGVPSTVNNATSTPRIGMTLKRVNTKSGLVYEMVNCGTNQNMGTGEAKEQVNVANRTVSRKVPEGGNSEKTTVMPGVTTNKVINEKVNTIQHSSVGKRAPSQLTTMKNIEQNIEDKKLIQQLEAEIAKMGRQNVSVELQSKVTNVPVKGQTSLQPIHLPGTSNQSQNLPSGYLIYSFPSTSRTNASKSTTCSTNAVPKISQDVPTTSTHVQEITSSQATNLPGTSTQTSGNVSQKPLPTPLLYSLPTGNQATAPVGALYHLLAGHNLIFLPQQNITPASSQVQTTGNSRSILLNKQTNVTLSPSVQMPSPATVTSQVQLSPTTAVVSNSDATNTNVSKIRVKDIKELS